MYINIGMGHEYHVQKNERERERERVTCRYHSKRKILVFCVDCENISNALMETNQIVLYYIDTCSLNNWFSWSCYEDMLDFT